MRFTRIRSVIMAAVLCFVAALATRDASAHVLFVEDFQNPAPSTDVANDYPEWTFTSPSTADGTAAGVFRMSALNTAHATVQPALADPGEPVVIFGDVGSTPNAGSYNVGMIVGPNRLVFHPGYPGGGAFRIEGANATGNLDMGWVPAENVLHHFRIEVTPAGLVTYTITDALNPNQTYTGSYVNAASYNAPVGFTISGGQEQFGLYDNLAVVPEPASLGLLAAGTLTLLARRRRQA